MIFVWDWRNKAFYVLAGNHFLLISYDILLAVMAIYVL